MKNRKGFTLIELLAVIVVLAIIALITIPQVLGMTEKSRNQANMRSIEGHIRNVDNQLAMDKFQNQTKNGIYNFTELNLNNFPKKDHLRCEEYSVDNNVVTEAKNCLINNVNYCYLDSQAVECDELNKTLRNQLLADNEVKTETPDFTTSIEVTADKGLYKSTDTNSGKPTYYFRGNVDNNYVRFGKFGYDVYKADITMNIPGVGEFDSQSYYSSLEECEYYKNHQSKWTTKYECSLYREANTKDMLWRVVRINEDGTVRLMLEYEEGIDSQLNVSQFNTVNGYNSYNETTGSDNYNKMYYSTSTEEYGAKYSIDKWYSKNIGSNSNYASKVASGNYFCEEAKFTYSSDEVNNDFEEANQPQNLSFMSNLFNNRSYTPTFKCNMDPNGHQYVNSNVGLITLDEALFAGSQDYFRIDCPVKYYFTANSSTYWTMSPAGFSNRSYAWQVASCGVLYSQTTTMNNVQRPVINLKASVKATKVHDDTLDKDVYVIE